jgi:hypothetical protein
VVPEVAKSDWALVFGFTYESGCEAAVEKY